MLMRTWSYWQIISSTYSYDLWKRTKLAVRFMVKLKTVKLSPIGFKRIAFQMACAQKEFCLKFADFLIVNYCAYNVCEKASNTMIISLYEEEIVDLLAAT